MMDAMAPVTVLSQFFQTENVDVALVKVHVSKLLNYDGLRKGSFYVWACQRIGNHNHCGFLGGQTS